MIRIERGAETSPGIWDYCVPSLRLCGRSRQPLLDACRQIKRVGGATDAAAGVYREGMDAPDISCRVEVGAETTVSDTDRGVKFVPYRPFALEAAA
jgi:hypothetical protein